MDVDDDVPGGLALALCNVAQEPEWDGLVDMEEGPYCYCPAGMAVGDALALQSRVVCTVRALALAAHGGGMDGVTPAYYELLCDCHDRCTAMHESPDDGLWQVTSYQQARLRNKASGWVRTADLQVQESINLMPRAWAGWA